MKFPIFKNNDRIISRACLCVKLAFALAVAGPLVALADVSQPCPKLVVQAQCDGSRSWLHVAAPVEAKAGLRFLITAQRAGVLAREETLDLAAGAQGTLALRPHGTERITLAVLGREPDETGADAACCFSNMTVPVAVCPEAVQTGGQTVEQPWPDAPEGDLAIGLTLQSPCTRDAKAVACKGRVTLRGPAAGPTDLSLALTPQMRGEVTIAAAECTALRAGRGLCALPVGAAELTLRLPAQAPKGQIELCLALGFQQGDVMALQWALTRAGFAPGPVDGAMGDATRAALRDAKAAAGLANDSAAVPEDLRRALKIGVYSDSDPGNDQICATTTLPAPPLICDGASTRALNGSCACRFKGMHQIAPDACACPNGQNLSAKGCITPEKKPRKTTETPPAPPAKRCNRLTTTQTEGGCACRYRGMVQIAPTACLCKNGLPPIPGIGCVVVLRKENGGDGP